MQFKLLGNTGLKVSPLSMGASALGAVFHPVDESQAIAAVHAAQRAYCPRPGRHQIRGRPEAADLSP